MGAAFIRIAFGRTHAGVACIRIVLGRIHAGAGRIGLITVWEQCGAETMRKARNFLKHGSLADFTILQSVTIYSNCIIESLI